MDLGIMFDCTLDSIDSVVGRKDFHTELQKCALRCAKEHAPIHDEWNDMLSSILQNWDADVKMSPYEAVDYMMTICGYGYLGEETIELNKSDFWFLQSEQCKALCFEEEKSKRLYYMTIAIFETINYWCWHDAPVQITFDSEGLKWVLRYGSINIDWNSHKKIVGDDSSLLLSYSLPIYTNKNTVMEGLFDFLNVDFLHNCLPNGWFEDAHQRFGDDLTDEMIVQSVQEASDFFNMNAPMSIHEDWTTGVMTGMTFTENDDILIFNRQQMLDMGITDKEGFDLVMTHEGAHRALQGLATGLNSHQEELCCDYLAGVRAGLNGMAEGKLEAALAGNTASPSHPDGAIRVQAIEAGVEYAHEYMDTNGIPPTFSDCLEHFYQTTVYASTLPYETGHINLSPEHAFVQSDRLEDLEIPEIHLEEYGNPSYDFTEDFHPVDEEHGDIKGIFIDNKAAQLKYAQEAKENAEWHDKRTDDCIARGDLSGAKDHAARAASYRKAEQDAIAASKKCTK